MKDPTTNMTKEFIRCSMRVEWVRQKDGGYASTLRLMRWAGLWFCFSKAVLMFVWCPAAWASSLRLAWSGIHFFVLGKLPGPKAPAPTQTKV